MKNTMLIREQTANGARSWVQIEERDAITLRRNERGRRPRGILLWLSLVLLALTTATVTLWVFERGQPWADNWLPNFIAEWTGIFVAVAIVDRLREREREAQVRPLRAHCYREILHYLDNIGLNASTYLENFVAAGVGLRTTDDPAEAVHLMDVAFARDAVPDPNSRRCWVEMLQLRAVEIDEICKRNQAFIPTAVIVPVLALVNEMRTCAAGFSELSSWAPTRYEPIGVTFQPAHAAVTAALSRDS